MQYTIRGLYDKLGITLAELSRRSGISDVTLASIRDGKSARRSTINTLLSTFSDIYGVELSTDNVSGIIIKDKLARLESTEQEQRMIKKPIEPPVFTPVLSAKAEIEKPSKRVYNRKQDTSLPDGCILASKFAENHSVKRPTFIEHMTKGIGAEKDRVDYSERDKPNRNEKEKYLTRDQQSKALDFWEKHKVKFALCEDADCICHELFEMK